MEITQTFMIDGSTLRSSHTYNPFCSAEALRASSYAGYVDERLVRLLDNQPPSTEHHRQHRAFRAFLEAERYPCNGAKAALNSANYRLGVYGALASWQATAGLARDLFAFLHDPLLNGEFRTYAAVFADDPMDERSFEAALWAQLRALAAVDRDVSAWDASVSDDPADPRFSFSFGATALFVIGLHPNASRLARRFSRPMLVFNPHRQFESIRERGGWERFTRTIRRRDVALQGSPNPNLAHFGEVSEAHQYSGRAVEPDWQCPFHR